MWSCLVPLFREWTEPISILASSCMSVHGCGLVLYRCSGGGRNPSPFSSHLVCACMDVVLSCTVVPGVDGTHLYSRLILHERAWMWSCIVPLFREKTEPISLLVSSCMSMHGCG